MSVNIYTNYFVDRLTANHKRLQEGTLGRYEYYESYSHDTEMNINDCRFKLTYKLRIEIADKEGNALPTPDVTIAVTFEAYEHKDLSILNPSAQKKLVTTNSLLRRLSFLNKLLKPLSVTKHLLRTSQYLNLSLTSGHRQPNL